MGIDNKLKPRKVENLKNYNEKIHLEVAKQGDLERYENEYHLMEQSLNLPAKFIELGKLEQQMVLLFVDKDFIEPISGKHTENNAFISFLASYENKEVIKKIYIEDYKIVGYDKDGEPIEEKFIKLNPEHLDLYMKLKKHSAMIWKKYNLKEISKSMREIIANDGFRDTEILEQTVIADALSKERDSFTMQNRRLAIDIKGLKKPKGLQSINVFLKGGGQESTKIVAETSGNNAYDIVPEDEDLEEVDIIKDNKD